jgi:hypothetical protein
MLVGLASAVSMAHKLLAASAGWFRKCMIIPRLQTALGLRHFAAFCSFSLGLKFGF